MNKHVTINGKTEDADIANEFSCHFNSVFYNSSDDILSYDEHKRECEDLNYVTNTTHCNICANVSVENIHSVIRNLKFGKKCGPDDLAAEHVYYSHPGLTMHLRYLICSTFTQFCA